MAMSITGLIVSLHLVNYLSTIVCNVESRQIHLNIRKEGVISKEPFYSEKTRRLVECAYNCFQHTDCKSLGYNKTSAICHLYPSHIDSTQKSSGTLLLGNLREEASGRDKNTRNQTSQISTKQKRIVLKRTRNLTWRKASEACGEGRLIVIHNGAEQATAENILKDSGLECVAIGAFRSHFKWETTGGYDKLIYSDWAEDEPGNMDFYVGLTKKSGYKWEGRSLFQKFDGGLCEED